MRNYLKALKTRFRAYCLGEPGGCFSYYADDHLTLIDARLTEKSLDSLREELRLVNKQFIDTLHITSWDQDHCNANELEKILEILKPSKIEYPSYKHDTDNYERSIKLIRSYKTQIIQRMTTFPKCIEVSPTYIKSLKTAERLAYDNVLFHPKQTYSTSNDNSLVKLFRYGMFNVASLGDVESEQIASLLKSSSTMKNEVDVLILAHHGSDCALNSKSFFQKIKPQLVVSSSNYDNQYQHPTENIRNTLYNLEIPIYTTKTGDVIIESIGGHRKEFQVCNLTHGNEEISSSRKFVSKKFNVLSQNWDTINNKNTRKGKS